MSDLHQFNPGKKSWKMYANTITSISGDDLTISPYDGKDLILEVSGNNEIIFKKGDTSYNLADLTNVGGNQNGDDVTFQNVDMSGLLTLTNNNLNSNVCSFIKLKMSDNNPTITHGFFQQTNTNYGDYQIYPSNNNTDLRIGNYTANNNFSRIRLNANNGIKIYKDESLGIYGDLSCQNLSLYGFLNVDIIKGGSTIVIDPAVHNNNTGKLVIKGDLEVQGDTTTINSTTLDICDNRIKLNADSNIFDTAGIDISFSDGTNKSFYYSKSDNKWKNDNTDLDIGNGSITANTFIGDGSNLTGINLKNYDDVSFGNVDISGKLNIKEDTQFGNIVPGTPTVENIRNFSRDFIDDSTGSVITNNSYLFSNIAYSPTLDLYVAFAPATGYYCYSTDSITWNIANSTVPANSNTVFSYIIWCGGNTNKFISFFNHFNGVLGYSSNGMDWNSITFNYGIQAVAFSPVSNIICLVGASNNVVTAETSDGNTLSFTKQSNIHGTDPYNVDNKFWNLSWNSTINGFVGANHNDGDSNNKTFWYSDVNGENWTYFNNVQNTSGNNETETGYIWGIAHSPSLKRTVSVGNRIYYTISEEGYSSPSDIIWKETNNITNASSGWSYLHDVIWIEDIKYFVACGDKLILYSSDGINWDGTHNEISGSPSNYVLGTNNRQLAWNSKLGRLVITTQDTNFIQTHSSYLLSDSINYVNVNILGNLYVNGDASFNNIEFSGGNGSIITANTFIGDGSNLTGINLKNYDDASFGNVDISGKLNIKEDTQFGNTVPGTPTVENIRNFSRDFIDDSTGSVITNNSYLFSNIAYSPTLDIYVAFAPATGYYCYSTDSITWNIANSSVPSNSNTVFSYIIWCGGNTNKFISFFNNFNGVLGYSSNGMDWNSITFNYNLAAVAFSPVSNIICLVGADNNVVTAETSDGNTLSFTKQSNIHGTDAYNVDNKFWNLSWNSTINGFVGANHNDGDSNNKTFWYSDVSGENWTYFNNVQNTSGNNETETGYIWGIAHSPSLKRTVSVGNRIYYTISEEGYSSPSDIIWKETNNITNASSGWSYLHDVIWIEDIKYFVACGDKLILYSSDGINWDGSHNEISGSPSNYVLGTNNRQLAWNSKLGRLVITTQDTNFIQTHSSYLLSDSINYVNVNILGNLYVNGDASFNNIEFSGNIIPSIDDTFDIGSVDKKVRDIYVSNNTIYIGDVTTLGIDNSHNFIVRKRKTDVIPSGLFDNISNPITNKALLLADINLKLGTNFSSLNDVKLGHWKRYSKSIRNNVDRNINEIFQTSHNEDWEEIKGISDTAIIQGQDISFGDLDISGTLYIDNITSKTQGAGISLEQVNITGRDITNIHSIYAQEYYTNYGYFLVANNQARFSAIEMKDSNSNETFLASGDTGNVSMTGTLSIDNIISKTPLSGISLEQIHITNRDITNVNSISATNYAVDGVNIISAARQANLRDLELKNGNTNKVTLLAQGDNGDISMNGMLYVNTIKGGQNMVIDPEVHDNNTGKLIIKGDLEVQGTTTTINSTTLDICDNRIKLNATSSTDAGIDISFNDGTSKSFYYNKIESQWKTDDSSLNVGNGIITANSFIGDGSQLTGINLKNYDDASFGNIDISGTLLIKNGDFGFNTNIISLSETQKTNIYTQLTSTTTDSNLNSFTQLGGIAYSPTQNIYILISNTKMWSSSDCVTWNEVTTNLSSIFTSNTMYKNIKYISELDKFFVISRDKYSSVHTIWYSSTGLSWTISTLTGSDFNSTNSNDEYGDDYMQLTYIGNNTLICTILYMDDRDWEMNQNKHYLLSTDGGLNWYQYAYGNEYGTTNEITDVRINNNSQSITSTYIKHESRYILFYGQAYGTIKILYTTSGAKNEWSILNWTSHLSLGGQKNVPPVIVIYSEKIEKVVAIIVNYDKINIFYSNDGLTWTESVVNTNLPDINLSTSHFKNFMAGLWADSIDKFIVYTYKDTIESSDGINWSIVTTVPSSTDSNEFLLDKYKYNAILDKINGRFVFLLHGNSVVSTNSNYVNSLIESTKLKFGNNTLDISCDTINVTGILDMSGNILMNNSRIVFEQSDEYVVSNDNGIISLINDLCNNFYDLSENLLKQQKDASFNNLDVSGDLNINGGLTIYNNFGVSGEVLKSQGSNVPPIWGPAGGDFLSTTTTSNQSVTGLVTFGGYIQTTVIYGHNSGHLSLSTGEGGMWCQNDWNGSSAWINLRVRLSQPFRGSHSYAHVSDDRIKHNEVDLSNCLNTIRKLKPQKYQKTMTLKDENYNGVLNEPYTDEAGLIAQDLLKIPELAWCVDGGEIESLTPNDPPSQQPYSVAYHNIEMYHIQATKELDAIVQNQQTEINNLKNENNLLKSKLNELLAEAGKETI
jgi:hypothetical protein